MKPVVEMNAVNNCRVKMDELMVACKKALAENDMMEYHRAFAEWKECSATYRTLLKLRYNL